MTTKTVVRRISVVCILTVLALLVAAYAHKVITTRQLSEEIKAEHELNMREKESLQKEKSEILNLMVQKRNESNKRKKDRFQKYLTYAILEMRPSIGPVLAKRISGLVITESEAKGLNPILVTALIWTESRFDPLAHSNKGAVGLMQVRYSTWKETLILKDNGVSAKHKLFWPELNIKCGTKILEKYYEQSNRNMAKALYRYNTGNKELPKDKRILDIAYVNKIMLTTYNISDLIQEGKTKLIEELSINQ